ncbi:MAG TPA: hypothetical protein VMF32_04305 [Xanthobacteraceae bacterium]|nr:hypothetical protein [Xanthobacteraceae bacterium]
MANPTEQKWLLCRVGARRCAIPLAYAAETMRAAGFQARLRCPELAVLLTTGYANEGDRDRSDRLIREPYHGNELAAKLREALSSG